MREKEIFSCRAKIIVSNLSKMLTVITLWHRNVAWVLRFMCEFSKVLHETFRPLLSYTQTVISDTTENGNVDGIITLFPAWNLTL